MNAAPPVASLGPLYGRRILVIEDEPLVAMMLEDSLIEAGASVLGPAGSVEMALLLLDNALANGGISAAVLDLNLAGSAALPVSAKLDSASVPYVVATGYMEASMPADRPGAPVMTKPYDPEELVRLLATMMPPAA
jgi:DNA-binding response OmpR family regulator